MTTHTPRIAQHIEELQAQLHALKDCWGSHLDFWEFIGAKADISARSAYNFATGRNNAKNSTLSNVKGIEDAINAARDMLETHREADTSESGLYQ